VRRETAHARGSILRAHFANVEYAQSKNVAFDYVMFHASTSRFLFPGVEEYIFRHEFVRIQHPPYFVFDIWGRKCTQFSAQKRTATETPIAKFFGAITPTIEAHYTGSCTRDAVQKGSMCNRAGFSQHEGSFFPRETAETILNFLGTTPHYNSTRFNETVAATRNNGHTHLPESMTILDWMPRVMGVAGASPEETWIPTFISLLPKLQAAYKAASPSAPVDRHWTKRNEKVAICDVLAILEYRDHARCDFPHAVKRFAHLRNQGMEENTAFFECLASEGHELIMAWPTDQSKMPWDSWKYVGQKCFELAQQKVPGFIHRAGPGIPKCLMDPAARKALMSKVFGAFPFGCEK
jgi:hypothetical protein